MLRAGVDHIPYEWVSTLPVRTRVGIRDWWADRGDRNIDALPERYPIKQSSERHDGAQEEEMEDPDGKYRTQWQCLKHSTTSLRATAQYTPTTSSLRYAMRASEDPVLSMQPSDARLNQELEKIKMPACCWPCRSRRLLCG